jgi:hypothetical protein
MYLLVEVLGKKEGYRLLEVLDTVVDKLAGFQGRDIQGGQVLLPSMWVFVESGFAEPLAQEIWLASQIAEGPGML